MNIVTMKMAVAAAVMAAFAGGASLGAGGAGAALKSLLVQHGRAVAGGHIVVYFLMKMLQFMNHLKQNVKCIADKTTYIEQRIDAAAAKSGDIFRHMQQIFLCFDEAANAGKTQAMKWWWVERRLRGLYEDFSNSKAMEKCNYEVVKRTWAMMQLECKLRTLRDAVACRHYGKPPGDDDDMEWAVKNMMKAGQYCFFWRPMKISELDQLEVQSCFEELLFSQIAERMKELKQYLEGADPKKYEDLDLEGIVGGSSNK
jgi:hypothetical protein